MKIAEVSYEYNSGFNKIEYCFIDSELLDSLKVKNNVLITSPDREKVGIINKVIEVSDDDLPIINSTVTRIISERDLKQLKFNEKESQQALLFAKKQANNLGLSMSFVESFYTFDRKQLFFTYTADSRVDFRELAKILAQKYKTRIELRQIGVRDKAKKVGGLGPCGLFLCCNAFLTDFISVSINMAKNQSLALNPSKINGLCGRLLCCLNYEDATYTELKKDMPTVGSYVETKEGSGTVLSVDIFHRTYKIETKNKEIIELGA